MTNKQTIDGVSRETIRRIADHCKFWIDHPYLEAIADVEVELRALLDKPAKNAFACWSCKKLVTMSERADADGDCPHCGSELDIDDWPFQGEPADQPQESPLSELSILRETVKYLEALRDKRVDAKLAQPQDTFNGDNKKLVGCIKALLSMDAEGVLIPHGIGGHARALLEAAAARISSTSAEPKPRGEVDGNSHAPKQQGEPVAWYKPHWNGLSAEIRLGSKLYDAAFPEMWHKLYAEQPAPVAVVLPERLDLPARDEYESADQHAAALGEAKKWNSCLDEVARLNTP